ncbi:MAG: 4Fe-4S binding protein [Fusobacteriaceae bacterium]|jgi:polyferredoxin|nr:4Fe-4S binding protein [Fusobacteriaceae bacterium]
MRERFQAVFFLLSNFYLKGFLRGTIYQGRLKSLCLPGLNCWSCPGALGSCPMGALQGLLAAGRFPFYALGFLFVFGAALGRFVCGWLCPFGFFQDLLWKIPFFRKIGTFPGDRPLRRLKYGILVVFVILLPLLALDVFGLGLPWFCKWICPGGTLFAGLPLAVANGGIRNLLGFLFFFKLGILLFLIALGIMIYRPFCKYLCPLGALYAGFNGLSLYRYGIARDKCTGCGHCAGTCPMNVDVLKNINGPECIRCGRCRKSCPASAIGAGFGKEKNRLSLFPKI